MDRRTLLKGAGLAVVGGFVLPRHAATLEGESLRDLAEVRSSGGVLDYRLDMAARPMRVGDRAIHVDTYNGQLPGPILRFRPGDQLRLLLRNRMRPMGIPLNVKSPPRFALDEYEETFPSPLSARAGAANASAASNPPEVAATYLVILITQYSSLFWSGWMRSSA